MNPLLKDILTFILPLVAGYSVLVTMRERQRRSEVDETELKKDVKQFVAEFKTYLDNLNNTMHEHTVMQKITTSTLAGLITKMESLEVRVNKHDTELAILNKD